MANIVGIDLGTSTTVVARFNDSGQAESTGNIDGEQLTPSVVQIESDGVVICGKEAKKLVGQGRENVFAEFKRDMGGARTWPVNSRAITPEDLSGFLLKLVLIDYLQKIHGSKAAEKKTYEIAEVSGRLKAIASDTKTAVVALAQLNRENEKDKGRVPRLTDLADSGQIERDADLVLLLNRERNQPNGEAIIAVAKQRDGECGLVPLWYEGQFCRFTDPSPSFQ
jgi:replicative DNA helicase